MMIWCEPIFERLVDADTRDHLPHALLFLGQAGLGKRELAQEFSQYLLCGHSRQTKKACGACQDCRLFSANTHGDFYKILPENQKTIGIDQIREMKSHAYQTSQRGRKKIFVIVGAETMTTAASNAALKILEEPPLGSLFILTSESKHRLSATILSRCHAYHFCVKDTKQVEQWLSHAVNKQFPEEDIISALRWAQFSPLLAKKWLQENKVHFFNGLEIILKRYFHHEASSYDLVKYCQEKALADVLFGAYIICFKFLKTSVAGDRPIVYHFLSKIIGAQKLFTKHPGLNEGLLLEALF